MVESPFAVTGIAASGVGIIFIVDPFIMYAWMLVVVLTCLIICINIAHRCNKRNKRIEMLSTRAKRRLLLHGDSDGVN